MNDSAISFSSKFHQRLDLGSYLKENLIVIVKNSTHFVAPIRDKLKSKTLV
jgi:hypothetical protein